MQPSTRAALLQNGLPSFPLWMWPFASQPAWVLKGSWQSTYSKMLHLFEGEKQGGRPFIVLFAGLWRCRYSRVFQKGLEAISWPMRTPRTMMMTMILSSVGWDEGSC